MVDREQIPWVGLPWEGEEAGAAAPDPWKVVL